MSAYYETITVPADQIQLVFGQFDRNIKNLEKAYHVAVVLRDDKLRITGSEGSVKRAVSVIEQLVALADKGEEITDQNVNYAISLSRTGEEEAVSTLAADSNIICHTTNGKPVKAKTLGQKKYVEAIDKDMIVFGVGPAGTGKTYLAMAKAITAFKNNEVNRIILTRPAIEAGENLGFLPGDLQSKIDPYLRPLYVALYQIMGAESFQKNMEKGAIEVARLAYMRGRTIEKAFDILDDAHKTTMNQIKMFFFEQFYHLFIRLQGFKGYRFARRKIDLMKNNIHVFKICWHTFGPSVIDICSTVYFISHFLKSNNIVR